MLKTFSSTRLFICCNAFSCSSQRLFRALSDFTAQSHRAVTPTGFIYIISLFLFYSIFSYTADRNTVGNGCVYIAGTLYTLFLWSILQAILGIQKFFVKNLNSCSGSKNNSVKSIQISLSH